MKNVMLLKLSVLMSLFVAHQAFGWQWSLTNWAKKDLWTWGTYPGCRDDHPIRVAANGGVQHLNAHECLLSSVQGKEAFTDIPAIPHILKPAQRIIKSFHAIGPINNKIYIGVMK